MSSDRTDAETEQETDVFTFWTDLATFVPECFGLEPALFPIFIFTIGLSLAVPVSIKTWLHTRRRKAKTLPGPWSWPMFGHVSALTHDLHLTLTNYHKTYGDIYGLRLGQHHVVVLGSLEVITEALLEKGDITSGRPVFGNFHCLYDEEEGRQRGVCTADYNEKTCIRRSFLSCSVDAYCSDVAHIEEKLSSEIVDTVNRFIESGEGLEPWSVLKPACFNIMFRLVYSQRFDPNSKWMQHELSTLDNRHATLRLNPVDFCPFLKIFNTKDQETFVQEKTSLQLDLHHKFLNYHKDTYDQDHIRDMTDQLLLFMERGDDLGSLGKEDLDYLLLDAVNFGYMSVSILLTWLLGYMAADMDLQKEVQAELDKVIGQDRLPGLEDQAYLPLTTACILEGARMASIHPFYLPHRVEHDTTIKGFHIPKDSLLFCNVWKVHHDPRLWKDPHKFNPRRFLTSDNSLEIPDHFLPYSIGPRQCPGEGLADVTLFLMFSTLLHQTSISPVSGFPLRSLYDYVIKPKPFTLAVVERD